jgi:uncharacterized protein YhjY with autotransporter beta-barrel domain
VGVSFASLSVDSYEESGSTGLELVVEDDNAQSLQMDVGIQASTTVDTRFGLLVPQAGIAFIHEFENDARLIDAHLRQDLKPAPTRFSFRTDEPDRNFLSANVGVSAILPNGLQPFVAFRSLIANSDFNSYAGTAGLRVPF